VARRRGRRRGRVPHGANRAHGLPCRGRIRIPRGRAHRGKGLRRPEVHRLPHVRGKPPRGIPLCPTSRS
jgi:hypothetical protein